MLSREVCQLSGELLLNLRINQVTKTKSISTLKPVLLRLKNSNQLENSLQNGKTLLSGYENKLAREEVAPADITSLEKTQRELGVRWLFHSTLQTFNSTGLNA